MTDETILTKDEFIEYITSSTLQNSENEKDNAKFYFLKEVLTYFRETDAELQETDTEFQEADTNKDAGLTYTDDDRIQGYLLENDILHIYISDFSGENRELVNDLYGYQTPQKLRQRIGDASDLIEKLLFIDKPVIHNIAYLFEFQSLVVKARGKIKSVTYNLFTDLDVPTNKLPDESKHGINFKFYAWSLDDIYEHYLSGKCIVRNEIDLEKDFTPLPCLPVVFPDGASYKSYLVVVPGKVLAELYEKYNEKILEANVRVFLQDKRPVNKKIRKTLVSNRAEREKFFAYNNGLSATAENVEVVTKDGSSKITKIRNLQIVNGGQTTASIHNVWQDNKTLDGVYVQMKLTEVTDSLVLSELMPKIAEYSNTQTALSSPDFLSNKEFFKQLHRLSLEITNPDGVTHWFYERLAGQFGEMERVKTKGDKSKEKDFKRVYPSSYKITKSELGLYYLAWNSSPHIAAKGGSKNFKEYVSTICNGIKDGFPTPDKAYFKEMVALALLFRKTDKLVKKYTRELTNKTGVREYSPKQQIALYTLSLLSYITKGKLNLEKIWGCQSDAEFTLPVDLENYLDKLMQNVRSYFIEWGPQGIVTEWTKDEKTWTNLRDNRTEYHVPFPEELSDYLLTDAEVKKRDEWLHSLYSERDLESPENVLQLNNTKTPDVISENITSPEVIEPGNEQTSNDEKPSAKVSSVKLPEDLAVFLTKSSGMEISKFISQLQFDKAVDDKVIEILQHILAMRRARKRIPDKMMRDVVKLFASIDEESESPDNKRSDEPKDKQDDKMISENVVSINETNSPVFEYHSKGAFGKMIFGDNDTYVLLKGSTITLDDAPSFRDGLKKLREKMLQNSEIIRNPDGLTATLMKDMVMDSSGAAAAFVSANNPSGPTSWKYGGKTLKEYLEQNK